MKTLPVFLSLVCGAALVQANPTVDSATTKPADVPAKTPVTAPAATPATPPSQTDADGKLKETDVAKDTAKTKDEGTDKAKGKASKASPEVMKARMEKRFGKLDSNSDGFLTKDEFKDSKMAKKQGPKAEKRFARWDKDSDGKLSKDEWTKRPVRGGKKTAI